MPLALPMVTRPGAVTDTGRLTSPRAGMRLHYPLRGTRPDVPANRANRAYLFYQPGESEVTSLQLAGSATPATGGAAAQSANVVEAATLQQVSSIAEDSLRTAGVFLTDPGNTSALYDETAPFLETFTRDGSTDELLQIYGLEYSAMGLWIADPADFYFASASGYTGFSEARIAHFGLPTPEDQIPTTGSAVYSGSMRGIAFDANNRYLVLNNLDLTANFATSQIEDADLFLGIRGQYSGTGTGNLNTLLTSLNGFNGNPIDSNSNFIRLTLRNGVIATNGFRANLRTMNGMGIGAAFNSLIGTLDGTFYGLPDIATPGARLPPPEASGTTLLGELSDRGILMGVLLRHDDSR